MSRRLRQMRRLVPLVSEQQQPGAHHNRAYASPNGNVDCLLVLNRQLDRSQLGFMGLLGIAETAIHQSQDTTRISTMATILTAFIFAPRYRRRRWMRRTTGTTIAMICAVVIVELSVPSNRATLG